MENIEIMSCPACDCTQLEPLGQLGSLTYHRCRACGLQVADYGEEACDGEDEAR